MVERSPEKAGVGGSTPSLATTHLNETICLGFDDHRDRGEEWSPGRSLIFGLLNLKISADEVEPDVASLWTQSFHAVRFQFPFAFDSGVLCNLRSHLYRTRILHAH